jgi:hypothetical protein
MTSLNDTQVFAELYYTAKAIKDVMGITVQCWRPPVSRADVCSARQADAACSSATSTTVCAPLRRASASLPSSGRTTR